MRLSILKKAKLLNRVLIQIILIAIIFVIFVFAVAGKLNARDVKQQVLEKQLALLIDASEPDTTLYIKKDNLNGYINSIEIKEGRVRVTVEGLVSLKGYPIITKHHIRIEEDPTKFLIKIR